MQRHCEKTHKYRLGGTVTPPLRLDVARSIEIIISELSVLQLRNVQDGLHCYLHREPMQDDFFLQMLYISMLSVAVILIKQ